VHGSEALGQEALARADEHALLRDAAARLAPIERSAERELAATQVQRIFRGARARTWANNRQRELELEEGSGSSRSSSSSSSSGRTSSSRATVLLTKHPLTLQVAAPPRPPRAPLHACDPRAAVQVEVKEGKIVHRAISGGTYPYLVVNCGRDQQASSTVQVNTSAPFWKDTFVFSVTDLDQELVINCHHWDGRNKGPGRHLGQVVFPLQHLLAGNLVTEAAFSVQQTGTGSGSDGEFATPSLPNSSNVVASSAVNSNRLPWGQGAPAGRSAANRHAGHGIERYSLRQQPADLRRRRSASIGSSASRRRVPHPVLIGHAASLTPY